MKNTLSILTISLILSTSSYAQFSKLKELVGNEQPSSGEQNIDPSAVLAGISPLYTRYAIIQAAFLEISAVQYEYGLGDLKMAEKLRKQAKATLDDPTPKSLKAGNKLADNVVKDLDKLESAAQQYDAVGKAKLQETLVPAYTTLAEGGLLIADSTKALKDINNLKGVSKIKAATAVPTLGSVAVNLPKWFKVVKVAHGKAEQQGVDTSKVQALAQQIKL
jgi:hypothetical protein